MKDYSAEGQFNQVYNMLDKLQACPLHRDDQELGKLCKKAGDIFRDFLWGTEALKKKADKLKKRLDSQEKKFYEKNKERFKVLNELQDTAKSLKEAHDEFVIELKKKI